MDAEGGVPRQLTSNLSDDFAPSWSRDGRWIYFSSDRDGGRQIWKMPAEGGEAVQVTRGGGFSARESPDGRHLYYTNALKDPTIWRVPVDGGEEIEVVEGPLPFSDDWTLTSSGIYYTEAWWASTESARLTGSIHFFDFESGQSTEFIRRDGVHVLGWLAASPDEEWILYVEMPSQEADLVLVQNFR